MAWWGTTTSPELSAPLGVLGAAIGDDCASAPPDVPKAAAAIRTMIFTVDLPTSASKLLVRLSYATALIDRRHVRAVAALG